MTFSQFSHRWSETILPLHKPATGNTVRSHLVRLNREFGQVVLGDLDYQVTQKFFSRLAVENSPKTLRNLWSSMNLILNQAKREGLISQIPKPTLPKIRRTEQDSLTAEQMRSVISKSAAPFDTLFSLLAETGMRIGEALGLRCRDLDLARKTLTIRRSVYAGKPQDPKTSSSFRTICLSSRLNQRLSGIDLNHPEAYVFGTSKGTPLRANYVLTERFHPVLLACGLPPQGFHSFRRGSITILAHLGCPEKIIASRVGHTIPNLTLGVYAQKIEESDRMWSEKLGEILW